jgi:hypothetical protein
MPKTNQAGKAPTVRLRPRGTPSENRAALVALATVLDIQEVSRSYLDRSPSTLERVYMQAVPHKDYGEKR